MSMVVLSRIPAEKFRKRNVNLAGVYGIVFAADWCPFCQAFLQSFSPPSDIRGITWGLADLTRLDSPLWEEWGIDVIPTLMIFVEGRLSWRGEAQPGRGITDELRTEFVERAAAFSSGFPVKIRRKP